MSAIRRATLLHVEDRDVYCRNGCQYYGNPEWEGYCSKCYKLIRQQQARTVAQAGAPHRHVYSEAKTGGGTADFFGRFEEKKNRQKEQQRGSKTFKNLIKRANTLKENTTFSLASSWTAPILRDKKASDGLTALREDLHRRFGLRNEMCIEICKSLGSALEKMETMFKKNEAMSVISDMVQDLYQVIHDRTAQEVDQNVAQEAVELCEDFLISHTYEVLFSGLALEEEARDLGVLQRIRSLHWVRARHLELDIDDIHPTVKEYMDEAMKQLIFIDSKRSPKEKLACVIDAAKNIFKMLQAAPKGPRNAGADVFLPAMIYLVLRANPPRLHTNIKLVNLFSAQSRLRTGESGYLFTHLCGAVDFIENLTAGELQMPPEEFESYISGKAVPIEDALTEGARLMYHNMAAIKELHLRQDRLADASDQLKITLDSLQKDIAEQVEQALEKSMNATKPHEYKVSKSVPARCLPAFLRDKVTRVESPASSPQPEDLPAPLQPVLLHSDLPSEDDAAGNVHNADNNNGHSTSSCSAASTSSTDDELVTADENTIAATPDSAESSGNSVDEIPQGESSLNSGGTLSPKGAELQPNLSLE